MFIDDGVEMMFGVNYLGYFVLVIGIFDWLVCLVCIVVVSSGMYDLSKYIGMFDFWYICVVDFVYLFID